MADTVIGILTPLVVGLLQAILDVKENYKPELEKLKSTLESVLPRIQEISRLDEELTYRPKADMNKFIEQLQGGEEIVRKCFKIPSWNYIQKYRYLKKILSLDESLSKYFDINMQVETCLDVKQLRVDMNKMMRRWEGTGLGERGGGKAIGILCGDLCSAPEIPDHVVGLDAPLVELKRKLFREDVTVLGLCAPGGCGKTTLAAVLCQDKQVRDTFKENIFYFAVSSSPRLEVIIERLLGQLARGLGYQVPKFLNDEDAFELLRNLLKQREPEPILLVLDDVWQESVVRKFAFKIEGYKILVASRTAFNTFESKYFLETLTDADAMALFYDSAFPQGGDEYEKPDEDLLDTIVRGCKGVPLALDVIARSLRSQPLKKWRSAANKIMRGSIFDYENKDLLNCLESSLDSLDDTVRNCFIDLGSFREDERISASALIDIWVELYELDEDDAYVNLLELSTQNLINLVEITSDAREIDGGFNELFIAQHALLRDLAIYQSEQLSTRLIIDEREDGHSKGWREQEHKCLNARLVSIHTDEMLFSSLCDMELPEAEVLILNLSSLKYTLPPFMKKMEKLKILSIVNHGSHQVKLCDFTTLSYLSHLKRIRLEKVSIPSLEEFTIPLKNLQKISLVMCEVGQAFRNCTIEIPKILPNLIEIDIDSCNDLVELPPGICDIIHLQKLSITNCHNLSALPEAVGLMTYLEELKLHACTGLLKLPDSIQGLQKLRFLDISGCSNINKLPEGIGELRGLKKLDLRVCLGVKELPSSTMDLGQLKIVICDEKTASLWEPFRFYLSELNIIVHACKQLKLELAWDRS